MAASRTPHILTVMTRAARVNRSGNMTRKSPSHGCILWIVSLQLAIGYRLPS